MPKIKVFKVIAIFGLSCLFAISVSAASFAPLAQALTYDQVIAGQTGGKVLGAATPAFVQGKTSALITGCCQSLTASAAFNSNTTAGNLIIAAAVSLSNTNYPTASISDTAGNSWTLATTAQNNNGAKPVVYIWYAKNIIGGADTVSATWTSSGGGEEHELAVSEYSGVDTSNPLDQMNSSYNGGPGTVTSVPTGNITTVSANDLLYSFLYLSVISSAGTPSVSANWTLGNNQNTDGSYQMDDAYGIGSSAGTYSNTFSGTNAYYGQAFILSFKASSGGSSDTQAPTVPTNLSATAVSSSAINLSWTASTDNVGVTGYKIYRGGMQVGTSATNSYSDTGLTASTQYTYTVSAYDAAGNNSAQSSSASAATQAMVADTTPPSTPTNLSASAVSSSQINLSWTASTDNVGVTGYKVFRAGTQIGTSATNSYSDTGLTASTQYTYTVSAYDAAGNSSSQSTSAVATTQAQQQTGSYPWSNILDPSRAIDWSGAGFNIPNYSVNCAIQPTLTANNQSAAAANATSIQNALNSCDSTHNVVNIPAGTYYVAGVTYGTQGKQVLRGAGPNATDIIATVSVGCSGIPSGICMMPSVWVYAGNVTVMPPNGNRQCLWTAGYAQGTKIITLNNCPGGSPSTGQMLVLDQANDLTDNGGAFICDSFTSSQSGGSPCTGNDGSPSNADGRQIGGYTYSQKQIVTVQSVNGSGAGPYTVTISPGVYFNNIRSSQNPGAWWQGTIMNEGLENMTIDGTSLASDNIQMVACYQCWVKNVRSIDAARSHIMLTLSANDVIRDSYFYQSQAHLEESYGIEPESVSGVLIENNIFQQLTDPIMTGNASGMVVDYNLSLDDLFTGWSNLPLQPSYYSHNAGNDMNLWEGNNFQNISTDDEWGSSYAGTFFRNMDTGWEIGKTIATNAFIDRAFARANNVIGSVLGQPGYHDTYESYATSGSGGINGDANGKVETSIYNLGWTGANGNGGCNPLPIICDPLVRSTLMRWGNYDTVTSGVKWDSTEASPTAVAYVNANFTPSYFSSLSHILPASLYYTSKPSWWPTSKAWPPIGPDVSGGNLGTCSGTYQGAQATASGQCIGGALVTAWASHANSIPAQDCYLNVMQGPPDGTGNVLPFDANNCYASGGSDTTPPAPPTGVIVN